MGLCGVTDIKKVDQSLVAGPGSDGTGAGIIGQLERLARLLEQGYLTRDEFETQKAKLLAG